jgi:hypothetical protein
MMKDHMMKIVVGVALVLLASAANADDAPRSNNGYVTCSIASYCLRQDGGGWTPQIPGSVKPPDVRTPRPLAPARRSRSD